MKIYNTREGVVLENESLFYRLKENWDALINDDAILEKVTAALLSSEKLEASSVDQVLPTIGRQQELWACGVTYYRSMVGRQEESKAAGGADFYGKVYEAERPECFFKSTPHRVVGNNGFVRIRKDSTWDVPEPELTLVVTASGKIIGYTIGNDMSSRSIEGENPLYLPQAKTYDGCAALGPCVLLSDRPLSPQTNIRLQIERNSAVAFEGTIALSQMKRTPEELVSFVYRECSFPQGCLIMTGTGIVPGNDFTLQSGDTITISIDAIGTLVNVVK
ncbi:MAG: fumarylacetoacetate hydrolase family protein [Bacteroidota bacterium]